MINKTNIIKEIEEIQATELAKSQKKSIRAIYREILSKNGKVLSQKELNSIAVKNLIPTNSYNVPIMESLVASDIQMIGRHGLNLTTKQLLTPISSLLRTYRTPQVVALKIHRFSLAYNKGSTARVFKNAIDKDLYSKMSVYFDKNASKLSEISKNYLKRMNTISKEVSSNTTKAIYKRSRQLTRARVNGKPLSREAINKTLTKEFPNDQVKTQTFLRTEVHATNQVVDQVNNIRAGYKYKVWVNRPNAGLGGDVRTNHQKLDGKIIPIDQPFKLGGENAMYPGDPSLSVGERINCRCLLEYKMTK